MKKLRELEAGTVFTYGGFRWIKIEGAEGEALALTENVIEDRVFDEKNKNNWKTSDLREYLTNDFYELLLENGANEKDFLIIETDLTADDGLKDYGTSKEYISLLTADLYRKNRHLLKPINNWWWWLATPYSCLASYSSNVRCVNSSGVLHYNNVRNGFIGVRPLCNLSSEILVAVDGEEEENEAKEQSKDLTELIKDWAKDRELDKASPGKQFLKVIEEVREIAEGMIKNHPEQMKDSIGGTYVTLVILAMQYGLDIKDCIKAAYEEIKDRKGETIGGVFIKEDDLENNKN